jgi:hypothetical protein
MVEEMCSSDKLDEVVVFFYNPNIRKSLKVLIVLSLHSNTHNTFLSRPTARIWNTKRGKQTILQGIGNWVCWCWLWPRKLV